MVRKFPFFPFTPSPTPFPRTFVSSTPARMLPKSSTCFTTCVHSLQPPPRVRLMCTQTCTAEGRKEIRAFKHHRHTQEVDIATAVIASVSGRHGSADLWSSSANQIGIQNASLSLPHPVFCLHALQSTTCCCWKCRAWRHCLARASGEVCWRDLPQIRSSAIDRKGPSPGASDAFETISRRQ